MAAGSFSWPRRVLIGLGVIALLVMTGSTLIAVFARYFGIDAFAWSYEVAGFAFIWVTFIGVIEAELRGENAAFELLRSTFTTVRAGFALTEILLLGGIGLWLLASGVTLVHQFGLVPTPLLGWPTLVYSSAAPFLGAVLSAVALVRLAAWRHQG